MSGVPLPVADLPAGTVTVRVIRGALTNPIASQTVEIIGAGASRTASTNESGRAEFTNLPAGARVRAVAMVGGERLESREFAVPSSGGIRLMLVAGSSEAVPASTDPGTPVAAPAQPGTLVLGEESRFVFEIGEDGLTVFYILQILNAATTAVQPDRPVVLELPSIARSASILQGSSPQASVNGWQVKVDGPFAPGTTLVQVAYTVPFGDANVDIEQPLPIALRHVAVVAQKHGDMRFASPQIAEQRDMPAQGNIYIAGRGGAVAAGETLRFSFSGLPSQPTWPRTLTLVLAVAVLAAGTWASVRAGTIRTPQETRRLDLESRRERLFEELTTLEQQHREQAVDPGTYAHRRRELIAALESIYTALDEAATVGAAS